MKGIFAVWAAALVVGLVAACGGAEKAPLTPDDMTATPGPAGSGSAAPAVPASDAGK